MKLKWIMVLMLSAILLSSFVTAKSDPKLSGASGSDGGLFDSVGGAFDKILDFASLSFIFGSDNPEGKFFGFVRILIAILIFSIIYLGISAIPGMGGSRNIAIVIALVLAIMTSIFIPKTVLASFGATYAILFSLIIIGGPVIGITALLIITPTPRWYIALVKLVAVVILYILVEEVSRHAQLIVNARPF